MDVSLTHPDPRLNRLKTCASRPWFKAGLALLILLALFIGYYQTGRPVELQVNGQSFPLRTHRLTVQAVLLQTGLALKPEDAIWPPPQSGLQPGQKIEITLARPVIIDNGSGARATILTHRQTPIDILTDAGFPPAPADDIYVDGVLWNPTEPVPVTVTSAAARLFTLKQQIEALRPHPVLLILHRAIPVHVDDNGLATTFFTTNRTVGDVLLARNIPLYLGDAITPDLSEPLTAETIIHIKRAAPVSIEIDGRQIKTRSLLPLVGEVLAQENLVLVGQDYTLPAESTAVTPNMAVKVVRVVETLEIDKQTTDFETIWVPDHELELDVQQVSQEGKQGITKTRTRVRTENGVEVLRVEEETWLEQSPADKVVTYGTKVVVRSLDTPDGPIEYWRKVRMLATSYSAATSGVDPGHPHYGITRIGVPAGFGVVAVDPSVILLRSNVYVPGYGQAVAGDTGGSILGKHIDLGFDEAVPPLWYRWVEVYMLTPTPPESKIRYVLPQWPQER